MFRIRINPTQDYRVHYPLNLIQKVGSPYILRIRINPTQDYRVHYPLNTKQKSEVPIYLEFELILHRIIEYIIR